MVILLFRIFSPCQMIIKTTVKFPKLDRFLTFKYYIKWYSGLNSETNTEIFQKVEALGGFP